MLPDFDGEEAATRRMAALPTPTERRLVAVWEGGRIELILPAVGIVSVGRALDSDLRIDDPSVSALHLLVHVGDDIVVEDAGSLNGSSVRHVPLGPGKRVALEPGDVVELGNAVLFARFGGEPASRVARPSSIRLRAAGERATPPLCVADPTMQRLRDLIEVVAPSEISVLLLGETGVGKEVVAHAIHEKSPRAAGPIIAINCAAVPETLFESELFGHEKGAFTGASTAKEGLLEAAHRGTLFLDEIGEMPIATQSKLLRAIERREITRVGSTKPTPIDVRFIAATQQNLERAITEGRFRQDLFYRLNGFTLVVPPLRERPASIRALSTRLLEEACVRLHRKRPTIGAEALRLLEAHAWPGNVRELRNVMERAALLCTGCEVRPQHLLIDAGGAPALAAPVSTRSPIPTSSDSLSDQIEELERSRILAALEECGGNQTLAAKRLGISRRRLLNRLDAYGVPRPRKRQ